MLDKKYLLHEPKSKGMDMCIPQMGHWVMTALLPVQLVLTSLVPRIESV